MKLQSINYNLYYLNKKSKINTNCNQQNNICKVNKKNSSQVNSKLALIYFYGNKSIKPAKRLEQSDYKISNYIAEINKARYLYGDKAVVDLSMGNPDLTPPQKAKQALKDKVDNLWSHRYNNPKGESYTLNTISEWMKNRFNLEINPSEEIMVTSGASDAIDYILTAYAEYGDSILVPTPGYSLYDDLINRHDLKKIPYNLNPDNNYQPDFSKMPKNAKSQIAFTPGDVFGSNGDGYIRIVMSANEKQLNEAFDRIKKAGIRFDVAKFDLTEELQKEIDLISSGKYTAEPKSQKDFKKYLEQLIQRRQKLTNQYKNKDVKFEHYIPKNNIQLPWNILKDGQSVYLQNIKEGQSVFGEVEDILPFSDNKKYYELSQKIKQQWQQEKYPNATILPPYKTGVYYKDAAYFVLKTEDKIQAVANLEVQNDGCFWIRHLNTAPWNQKEYRTIKNSAKTLIARIVSFCLETDNNTLKLATNKPENIDFYKSLGMQENGTRYINGTEYTVLTFDKKSMKNYLNDFQSNLSF